MISRFSPPSPPPPPLPLHLNLAYERKEKLCNIYIYSLVYNLVRQMTTTVPFVQLIFSL
jgi:hypothetical protein